MSFGLSIEQVLALAPDAASAKAGRGLAAPGPWSSVGRSAEALWGDCQGSGKLPYQTAVDLSGPAFKCSCPSRKFPCKHGLGLLLLTAQQPDQVPQREAPEWVGTWLANRQTKAEAKPKKTADAPADPAASAKRAAQRESRVEAGLADLDVWLADLVRNGLAAAQQRDFRYWDAPAARLVDAQAPGMARLVRELGGLCASGTGWQQRALDQLSRIVLLREGYRRLDTLTVEQAADIRALLGFTVGQDEVLRQTPVRDRWWVLGRVVTEEEQLRVQRTWLWGAASGRCALVLQFAPGRQALDTTLPPGLCFDASLCFYPGAVPLRALIAERHGIIHTGLPPFGVSLASAHRAWREAVARSPWLRSWPLLLADVTPALAGQQWWLRADSGEALPLSPRFPHPWALLSLSGGNPLTLFGEYDGESLRPLSTVVRGRLLAWEVE